MLAFANPYHITYLYPSILVLGNISLAVQTLCTRGLLVETADPIAPTRLRFPSLRDPLILEEKRLAVNRHRTTCA